MNLRISNDLKELIPTFSVIAYEINFGENYNAMQQSKLVDEYLNNIYKTYPTIYNYDENHSECWYQQSNDVYAFKTLAKEQFELDVITALEDSSGVRYNIESTVIGDTNTSSQGGVRCSYVIHENPEEKSDIVVNAKLVFVEEEEYLPSNGGRGIMYFDVYEIEPLDIIKGEDLLEKNNKVKIPKYSGINVNTNNNYKLCLRKREGAHVLLNPSQGIGVIK